MTTLPAPPLLHRFVLEQPLAPAAGLLVLGLACGFLLVQRGQAKQGIIAALAFILTGAAVLVTGTLVVTPRERAADATRRFITAVIGADRAAAEGLIADRLVASTRGELIGSFGRDELLRVIEGFDGFGVSEWSYRPRGAAEDGPGLLRTQATVTITGSALGAGSMPSTWEFGWNEYPDGSLRLVRLEALSMWGRAPMSSWNGEALRISGGGRGRGR
ncbi:MAG: hypothetical protein SFZ24_11760 [Planctomycetota bacterium]|nr:hypothetical protein [Planctomycetota bacterium]